MSVIMRLPNSRFLLLDLSCALLQLVASTHPVVCMASCTAASKFDMGSRVDFIVHPQEKLLAIDVFD
jgi:hypothetical protein